MWLALITLHWNESKRLQMSEKILEWDIKIRTTKQKQTNKHSIQKLYLFDTYDSTFKKLVCKYTKKNPHYREIFSKWYPNYKNGILWTHIFSHTLFD